VAYALFAATAPLVSQSLVTATGSRIMPAVYATVAAAIALPVLYRGLPEPSGFSPLQGAVAQPAYPAGKAPEKETADPAAPG
jgi:hypothetical protein